MTDEHNSSKNNRGGQRPGSGRKPILTDPITKQIRVERKDVEEIEKLNRNVSDFYRDAGSKELRRILKKKGTAG